MQRLLIILVLILLTSCEASTSAPASTSRIVEQWAKTLETGDIDAAKSLMIGGSPFWQESTQSVLAQAAWKNHKILDLPVSEQAAAPPGTLRVQWERQVDDHERFKLVCTDVRERSGKVEALTRTQYCTNAGSYMSLLEPLLFEAGDLPGAIPHAYGEYQTERMVARGMPQPIVSASVNAKRSADEPLPTYFVHVHVFDPSTAEQTFRWWQAQAPATRAEVSGVGERAFSAEENTPLGAGRSITFMRCNVVAQVNAFIPADGLAIDLSAVQQAAARVDQRLQAGVCGRLSS